MKRKAFTLIEMVATLTLMVILVTISSIAVGKTLKTNREKSVQMKVANVLRGTEDYILDNNIKLVQGVPLYFSISAMEAAGIMEKDITTTIAEVRDENGPFYVEALKATDGKVNYTILNNLKFDNNFKIVGAPTSTISADEKSAIGVAFKLQKPAVTNLYNLDISELKYTIVKLNVDGSTTIVANNETASRWTIDSNGIYRFNINDGLNVGEYRLRINVTSKSLTSAVITDDEISLLITRPKAKPLLCEVQSLPSTWYRIDVGLDVTCKQKDTGIKATSISYTGYRYPTTSEVGGTAVAGTNSSAQIDLNGKTTLTFSPQGVYKLDISAALVDPNLGLNLTSNTVTQTVRIDKTAPFQNGNFGLTGTVGLNGWYKSDVSISSTAGQDALSGFSHNLLSHSLINTNTTGVNVTLRAVDLAGNIAATLTTTIKVDKTAPACASSGGSAAWTAGSRTITGSCSDSTSGCTGNSTRLYNTQINTTTAQPWSVSDNAGWVTSCPADQIVRIDQTPPSCTSSGGSWTWFNVNRTIIGNCSDTGGSGCSGDSNRVYSSNIETTTAQPWSVSDNVGNTSVCPANQVVRIDKTAPSCTSSGGNAAWTTGSRTLTGTCTDSGGSGCVSDSTRLFNSEIDTTTAAPWNVSDNAGNGAACPANQTVRIDTTGPTAPTWTATTSAGNYSTASGPWTNKTITWTNFSATDAGSGVQKIQYSSGCTGDNWTDLGSSYSYTNHNYSFCLRALDNLNNIGSNSPTAYFRADQTAPSVTLYKIDCTWTGEGSTAAIGWGKATSTNDSRSPIRLTLTYNYPDEHTGWYDDPYYMYPYTYGDDSHSRILNGSVATKGYLKFQGLNGSYKTSMKATAVDDAGNSDSATATWTFGGSSNADCGT